MDYQPPAIVAVFNVIVTETASPLVLDTTGDRVTLTQTPSGGDPPLGSMTTCGTRVPITTGGKRSFSPLVF